MEVDVLLRVETDHAPEVFQARVLPATRQSGWVIGMPGVSMPGVTVLWTILPLLGHTIPAALAAGMAAACGVSFSIAFPRACLCGALSATVALPAYGFMRKFMSFAEVVQDRRRFGLLFMIDLVCMAAGAVSAKKNGDPVMKRPEINAVI